MTLWDGLETNSNDPTSNRILIIGATNRVQDLDAAILRRMPTRYHIPLPNSDQRIKIFELILKNERLHKDVNLKKLAQETTDYTGSDINEICRQAAMQRIVELCNQQSNENKDKDDNLSSQLRSITQADFLEALRKVHESHKQYQMFDELMLD
jgi:SpoVK/Ycf46/Vps4 family AAA+-type ATPase